MAIMKVQPGWIAHTVAREAFCFEQLPGSVGGRDLWRGDTGGCAKEGENEVPPPRFWHWWFVPPYERTHSFSEPVYRVKGLGDNGAHVAKCFHPLADGTYDVRLLRREGR